MVKFLKPTLLILLLAFVLMPFFVFAQSNDEVFKAEVEKILEEKETYRDDGSKFIQQNIKLRGLEKEWQDKEIIFFGIDDFEVLNNVKYQVGDKVLVIQSLGPESESNYYIVDYIRHHYLYWLASIFALLVIIIGKWKGLRALIGLVVSFFVIMIL